MACMPLLVNLNIWTVVNSGMPLQVTPPEFQYSNYESRGVGEKCYSLYLFGEGYLWKLFYSVITGVDFHRDFVDCFRQSLQQIVLNMEISQSLRFSNFRWEFSHFVTGCSERYE